MEETRSTEAQPLKERWLDVHTRVEYTGSMPTSVVFAYLQDGVVKGGSIAVDEAFDTNQIYGGLMAWTGRYDTATGSLVAVQISTAGQWYPLHD